MGTPRFTEDFKIDAVKQITERGYCVGDVSQRLGVSTHSLYAWVKKYSASPGSTAKDDQSAEIRHLKQEPARVTEERDILKKPPLISPRMPSEVRVYRGASPAVHRPHDVPNAPRSSQRVLCLAQKAIQQTGKGRSATDRALRRCLAGQRQGRWLVPAEPPNNRSGSAGPAHGCLAQEANDNSPHPFRSGIAAYQH